MAAADYFAEDDVGAWFANATRRSPGRIVIARQRLPDFHLTALVGVTKFKRGEQHLAGLAYGRQAKNGYARTWASQTALVAAGIACGAVVISAKDNAEPPLRVCGPGSNLADHTLIEVTAGGELILAGGTGNGYRLAELMGATNPSGWSGVLKVKDPAGVAAGYILLYSNP